MITDNDGKIFYNGIEFVELMQRHGIDTSNFVDFCDKVEQQAQDIYPPYLVEGLFFRNRWLPAYRLTIKFPEITIRNAEDCEHVIRAMYVYLVFTCPIFTSPNREFRMYGDLWGLRGEVTSEEFSAGYLHSHLNVGSYSEVSTFCLGESTMGNSLLTASARLAEIHEGVNVPDNDAFWNHLKIVLLEIEGFLGWESLDGVPYIEFREIGDDSTAQTVQPLTTEEIQQKFRDLCNNIEEVAFDTAAITIRTTPYSTTPVSVYYNEEFEKLLSIFYPKQTQINPDGSIKFITAGQAGSSTREDGMSFYEMSNGYKFPFKGTLVKPIVTTGRNDPLPEDNSEIFVDQKVRNYVKEQFEEALFVKNLANWLPRKKASIQAKERWERNNNDVAGNFITDLVPVSES